MKRPRYTSEIVGLIALAFVALTLAPAAANAQLMRTSWTNAAGDFEFTNAGNWTGLEAPGLPGNQPDSGGGETTNAIIQGAVTSNLNSNFTAANPFDVLIVRSGATLNIAADLNTNNSPILFGQSGGFTDTIGHTAGTVTATNLSIGDGGGDGLATYTMSGGAINLSGAMSLTSGDGSTFILQGDTATVDVGAGLSVNGASTLDFMLGASGVNAIDVTGTFTIDAADALLTVDGSSYTGDDNTTIDLVQFGALVGTFDADNVTLTGFAKTATIGYDADSMFVSIAPTPAALPAGLVLIGALALRRRR